MIGKIYWRDFSASLVILAIGVIFLVWASTYPRSAAEVPILVAWITIILALIDAIAQTETSAGRAVRQFVSAQKIIEWKAEGDEVAPTSRVLSANFWIFAYIVAVLLIGFLPATAAYVFLYMKLHGRKSVLAAAATAAGTTIGIWITFGVLFQYPLFPGLLFGGNL
ncbi:MAG TPA: tripartite tricarboxylate transporter TctB family protein [Xanthobacteraceae bacterium]|nr:tripartite tricarboxylate transporter TctB family protein [Xanthobacteraceae bacterium]